MSNRKMDTRWIEEEANYFAMCLLMPEMLVRKEFEKLKPFSLAANDSIVENLAKTFAVPENAMAVRLAQIKLGNYISIHPDC